MTLMKARPLDLKLDPDLPTGIWDPLWNEPRAATAVAVQKYQRLRQEVSDFGPDGLADESALPTLLPENTEQRVFSLAEPRAIAGSEVRFKGGSYGEIYRKYTIGPAQQVVHFHAQALTFGVDSLGRYFLVGVVGRVEGTWGGRNRAVVVVRFKAGDELLGALSWEGELDPPGDYEVPIYGRSEKLAARFDALTEAAVSFYTRP